MNEKKDLIVLTLGMNPLPCLVETYRICELVRKKTQAYPEILVLWTPKATVGPIRRILEAKLGTQLFWHEGEIADPFSPKAIADSLGKLKSRISWGSWRVHFPYTGGTKAVSMEAMLFLMSQPGQLDEKGKPAFKRYYLNPSTNRLEGEREACGDADERMDWNLTVADLASLHGLKKSEFDPVPSRIDEIADLMFRVLVDRKEYQAYSTWLNGWNDACEKSKNPKLQQERHWHEIQDPRWDVVSSKIGEFFPKIFQKDGSSWKLVRTNDKFFNSLVNNRALELYVYRVLRRMLHQDFDVRSSVKTDPIFELDVVAILGYQTVVVSCTMSAKPEICKKKAFEVVHRARQLGGDHAKAILISFLDPSKAQGVEANILDEMGLPKGQEAVQVYGSDLLDDYSGSHPAKLQERMAEYFEGLGWPTNPAEQRA